MKYTICILMLFLLISSCKKNSNRNLHIDNFPTRLNLYHQKIIGKEFNALDTVLDNNKITDKLVVLILSNGDCSSCIYKSCDILCELSNSFSKDIFIIAPNDFLYEPPCKILVVKDNNEIIKNKLNLIYTPSIIIIEDHKISDVFSLILSESYEGYNSDEETVKFIKKYQ